MPTKTCSKCHIEKSLDSFGKRKTSKDGRQSYCKQCRNKRDEGKQSTPEAQVYKASHYAKNMAAYKSNAKKSREKDPVAHAAKKKAYREKNAEKVAEGKKRCIEAKPEMYKNNKERHYQENREYIMARSNARYHGEKKEEIIAKQKEYVEQNHEKVMFSRKASRVKKKANAGKNLYRKLKKAGVNVQVFNANSVPQDYSEGLIYICSNSGNSLLKVGSSYGRGVNVRVSEHNLSSNYRSKGQIKKRDYYGFRDGCNPDWEANYVYLLPGIVPAGIQRIENKIVHLELSERSWHHLGSSGEWELFNAEIEDVHSVVQDILLQISSGNSVKI